MTGSSTCSVEVPQCNTNTNVDQVLDIIMVQNRQCFHFVSLLKVRVDWEHFFVVCFVLMFSDFC